MMKSFYSNNFSLTIPKCLLDVGPIEIIMKLNRMVDVFIHHEGQFNSPNSKARVSVEKGKFSKVAVIHEVVQQLGKIFNYSTFKNA